MQKRRPLHSGAAGKAEEARRGTALKQTGSLDLSRQPGLKTPRHLHILMPKRDPTLSPARRRRTIGHEKRSPESRRVLDSRLGAAHEHDHLGERAHRAGHTNEAFDQPSATGKPSGAAAEEGQTDTETRPCCEEHRYCWKTRATQRSHLVLQSPETHYLPRRRLQGGHGAQRVDAAQSTNI